MVKFDVKTVNDLLGIDDAFKAPERLMEVLLKKEEREELFRKFLKIDTSLEYDWFHEYFETEQAERKSKKQDFTPNVVAKLANSIAAERAFGLRSYILSERTKNGRTFVHGDWEFRREIK